MKKHIKQHIIETASGLFYKNGYNSTGINEIIKESNIAKATLYNHFKSKEEICIAYLKYKGNNFLSDIKQYCLGKPKGKEQVIGIYNFLKDFFSSKGFNGCWCIKTAAEIPIDNKTIKEEIQLQKRDFIIIIEHLIEENLASLNTEILAKQLYVLYEGAVAESHIHNEVWPINSAIEICNKIIE